MSATDRTDVDATKQVHDIQDEACSADASHDGNRLLPGLWGAVGWGR